MSKVFDLEDLDYLHDAVYYATDISLNRQELMEIFKKLPSHLQYLAFEWGFSDTEFREQVINYLTEEEVGYE